MADFVPADHKLFFSKNDPRDPRLGELVKSEGGEVALLGYPDDEGIKLNGGRLGAAEGPDAIRHWLYRMTPHPRRPLKNLTDHGNLKTVGTVSERHLAATEYATTLLKAGTQLIGLGGGNDYAYPDGLAFLESCKDGPRPLILNVDAHFDVRDLSNGPSSGTPFFRLLESGHDFEFIEIGIQAQCNSVAHWDYVERKGGTIITLEETLESGRSLTEYVTERLGESLLRRRPAFLAIDIDAFAWPYAIGSSASWPLGLEPHAFWPLYLNLLKRLDVRVLGIYEVSPPLDVSGGTAKLAAQFAHGFLHHV